ncbi:MAG: hydrogenase maturation protease [Alphaproteobacteria bacterium]|nr:hydrogenase maturation protease [Alphaproteobacteria bacterium]
MSANNRLVVGIGNEFRRDDGVGLILAERLKARQIPALDVVLHHGEGTGLMALWQGRSLAVVIDAVSSGKPAGSLHVIDAVRDSVPPDLILFSSHAFGLAEAVEMARNLDQLPKQLWIVGVEGQDFKHGQELSRDVASALDLALETVLTLITSPRADRAA